jgi:hypothetical protein
MNRLISSLSVLLDPKFHGTAIEGNDFNKKLIWSAIKGVILQFFSFAKTLRIEADILRDGKMVVCVIENVIFSSNYALPLICGIHRNCVISG